VNKRPQYEERYHITSQRPCPFCGGHEWVEFSYDHTWQNVSAKPVDNCWPRGAFIAVIDDGESCIPGEDVAECVRCGVVLS